MMSPLHHVFCGTRFLIDVLSVCVCVSCLYASCVCSIEIIIIMSHTIHCTGKNRIWASSFSHAQDVGYEPFFLLACKRCRV